MFIYLALPLIVLLIVLACYFGSRMPEEANSIPGPSPLPIVGNLPQLHVSMDRINDLFREWATIYYPVYKTWMANTLLIHIRHPDDLAILLSSTKYIHKKYGYEHFIPWLKTGLLVSTGEMWHQKRKLLTPTFHFNILKKYLDIAKEHSGKAIVHMRKDKEVEINLFQYCSKYTLNIICESAMGIALDDHYDKDAALKYTDAVHRMGNLIVYRMFRPYIYDWMVPFMPKLNRETTEVLTNLNNFTNKIINERREYLKSIDFKSLNELQEDKESESDIVYGSKKRRLAMLDLLLDAERKNLIDNDGIMGEVATFILAGYDATATAMGFTLMLLAENEEAQTKARNEIEQILNEKNGKLEISDLQKMNYLERCVKEALRLFPSIPTIVRHVSDDLQLKHCKVPKGSEICIHIIDVHRDPTFWPEPDKFDPDRFLPDQKNQQHTFAYVPFSAGSRSCLGQKFALMELKTFISQILYNFKLEPIDYIRDIKIRFDFNIRPNNPVYTKFIRIDRQISL